MSEKPRDICARNPPDIQDIIYDLASIYQLANTANYLTWDSPDLSKSEHGSNVIELLHVIEEKALKCIEITEQFEFANRKSGAA